MVSFYFAIFLILIIIVRVGLYFSKTKVIIKYLELSKDRFKLELYISIYLFNKIKILTIKFNEFGIKIGFIFISYEKILKKNNVEKFAEKTFSRVSVKKIKSLKLQFEEINFDGIIGTEDVFLSISIVTLISSFLGIVIAKNNKRKINSRVNYRYNIMTNFKNNICIKGKILFSFKTRRFGIFLKPKEHNKFKLLVGG